MHENATSQNETARARPAEWICSTGLCAFNIRTHNDHDECSPSRSSQTTNLLFIPHRTLLHASVGLDMKRWRSIIIVKCQSTISVRLMVSTIGCDRIPNNINLRYGLHCERSWFQCMKWRDSSPKGMTLRNANDRFSHQITGNQVKVHRKINSVTAQHRNRTKEKMINFLLFIFPVPQLCWDQVSADAVDAAWKINRRT